MRNVLVVNDKQLLGAAIKSLLTKARGITLFGFTTGCVIDLIEMIRYKSPDVLILDSSLYWETALLATLVRSEEMSKLKIIVVDASHNSLKINGILSMPITAPCDLVNVIRGIQPTIGYRSIDEQKISDCVSTEKRYPIQHRQLTVQQKPIRQPLHRS